MDALMTKDSEGPAALSALPGDSKVPFSAKTHKSAKIHNHQKLYQHSQVLRGISARLDVREGMGKGGGLPAGRWRHNP